MIKIYYVIHFYFQNNSVKIGNCKLYSLYCTIASKINVTPKGVYLPISKKHSILAVANLLAHNNISQNLLLRSNFFRECCSFSDNLTPLGVPFILLAMVHIHKKYQLCKVYINRIIKMSNHSFITSCIFN